MGLPKPFHRSVFLFIWELIKDILTSATAVNIKAKGKRAGPGGISQSFAGYWTHLQVAGAKWERKPAYVIAIAFPLISI